jgi:hypothetical protein
MSANNETGTGDYNVGASLVNDFQVNFLAALRQREGVPAGVSETADQVVGQVLKTAIAPSKLTLEKRIELAVEQARTHDQAADSPMMSLLVQDRSLEKDLKRALDRKLARIHLQWEGDLQTFRGVNGESAIKHEVMRGVRYEMPTSNA